jgi:hypothetical protein
MAIDISKLIGIVQSSKVVSTHTVKCKRRGNEDVDAIVIVFDDGYTEVSCPADNRCSCHYGHRPKRGKRSFYQKWIKPWLGPVCNITIVLAVAALVLWLANFLHIPPFVND